MGCLSQIVTPYNPCLNSTPCDHYTNAACVMFDGSLPCIAGTNLTLDVILKGMCTLIAGRGAGQVQSVKITVTSAQLKNGFSNPTQLIATPGAGKLIQLLSAYAVYTFGTTQYTANGATIIKLGQNSSSYVASTDISLVTGSVTTNSIVPLNGVPAVASIVNAPLFYYNDVANLTVGDGTLTFYLTYVITIA